MPKVVMTLTVLAVASSCTTMPRQDARIGIERAIVRDGGPAGSAVAAYAAFVNPGPPTQIIAAETACAEVLELHEMQGEGANRRMAMVWPLALPGEATTAIVPGSPRHLMLAGIKAPIAVGESCRLRFKLEHGEWIEADFTAVPDSAEAWKAFDRQ